MSRRTLVEAFMLPEEHNWMKWRSVRFNMVRELNSFLVKDKEGKLSPQEQEDFAEYQRDFEWELNDKGDVKILSQEVACFWMKSRPYDCRW